MRGRGLLLLLGCALALILGEVGLRLLRFEPKREIHGYYEGLLRVGIPHVEFYNRGETRFPNRVVYNNLGFHDREREAESDRYRILVVGDSYTEGRQVGVDALFTSRLEDLLSSSGHDVEVINAGQNGTGAADQYALWQKFLKPRLSHDHVLLALYIGNELHDNSEVLAGLRGMPLYGAFVRADGSVYLNPRPERKKRGFRLKNHSALVRTVEQRLEILFDDPKERSLRVDSTLSSHAEAWRDSLEGTLGLIGRWSHEARRERRAFSVVVIPTSSGFAGLNVYEVEFLERLRALAQEEQIPLLELDFSHFDPYELSSFDGRTLGHFNEEGHRQTALRLHAWLLDQQSIPVGPR